jgi:hypothetical protein
MARSNVFGNVDLDPLAYLRDPTKEETQGRFGPALETKYFLSLPEDQREKALAKFKYDRERFVYELSDEERETYFPSWPAPEEEPEDPWKEPGEDVPPGEEFDEAAWLDELITEMEPEYFKGLENKYGPDLMKAYAKSLEDPFEAAKGRLTSGLVARGAERGGYADIERARLAAEKQGLIDVKGEDIARDIANVMLGQGEGAYERALAEMRENLMGKVQSSEQTAQEYFAENQAEIEDMMNRIAQEQGYDFEEYASDYAGETASAFDMYGAIGDLFRSGGQFGSRVIDYYNQPNYGNMPVSQAVSPTQSWYNDVSRGGRYGGTPSQYYGGGGDQWRGRTI